jgi:NAD(P)-dependent dehydrogenase (short-subunit alcohol dehydrogenase family)
MAIDDKRFLITGAASGLGAATAMALAAAGARVLLVDLDTAGLERMQRAMGERARCAPADICCVVQAQAAITLAREAFGGLDGLINCAGIVSGGKILGKHGALDLEAFARVVNVNLIGSFNMLRLVAELMLDNPPDADGERGVIINTASVAAYDGQVGQAAYAASKGAIVSLTLPAARELAVHGIRVVTIAPGIFETPMMAGMSEEIRAGLAAGVPFPARLGRPEEYAALVRHIIDNRMLNGEVIRLDGALRMAAR